MTFYRFINAPNHVPSFIFTSVSYVVLRYVTLVMFTHMQVRNAADFTLSVRLL